MWFFHDGTDWLCCLAHGELVWPMENLLAPILENQKIQGWTTVREYYSRALEQGPLGGREPVREKVQAVSEFHVWHASLFRDNHSSVFLVFLVQFLHKSELHILNQWSGNSFWWNIILKLLWLQCLSDNTFDNYNMLGSTYSVVENHQLIWQWYCMAPLPIPKVSYYLIIVTVMCFKGFL